MSLAFDRRASGAVGARSPGSDSGAKNSGGIQRQFPWKASDMEMPSPGSLLDIPKSVTNARPSSDTKVLAYENGDIIS